MCRDYIDSLSGRHIYERCECAVNISVSWACGLWYSQSRVGVVGSRLLSVAENTETGFSDTIFIDFITDWQSFTREGACQG